MKQKMCSKTLSPRLILDKSFTISSKSLLNINKKVYVFSKNIKNL